MKEAEMVEFRNFVGFGIALAILVAGIVLFPFKDIFYVLGVSLIPVDVWMVGKLLDEMDAYVHGRPSKIS
jgi:hypothetical protein